MGEPLRHRQTKEAATDMFSLQPPRHISTLPKPLVRGNAAPCLLWKEKRTVAGRGRHSRP
jgi:hypothetical protein